MFLQVPMLASLVLTYMIIYVHSLFSESALFGDLNLFKAFCVYFGGLSFLNSKSLFQTLHQHVFSTSVVCALRSAR